MADKQVAELGDVQQTLFIPLVGRATETRRRHPALSDPKAVEIVESVDIPAAYSARWGGFLNNTRTLIFDWWVRDFLRENPGGTVIELGTGLNTRFERLDNSQCHWIDLDLPDTIELRRQFFADTPDGRRRMVAASMLDDDWHDLVVACPPPYFFVADGVLPYLPEDALKGALAGIAARFPAAKIAFDTYGRRTMEQQHKLAQRVGMAARWQWACDDPRTLESLGLRLVESVRTTRPPTALRRELPARYRWPLRMMNPLLDNAYVINLFEAAVLAG
jgi:O-methyltransferase involved in polyketide biosynthesis